MIAGYLSNTLVSKAELRNIVNIQEPSLDRRSTRLFDNKQQFNPLDLIKITTNLPQFQGGFNSNMENVMKQIQNTDFTSQILQIANPPNIDVVNQIKEQAKLIRLHYNI